jgi:hypothetical protein
MKLLVMQFSPTYCYLIPHGSKHSPQHSILQQEPGELSRYSDWLRAGRSKGRSPGRVKNFLFSTSSRLAPRSIQPIQWVPGALSPGIKRPGREADHSPPDSTEVKKMWIYTSIPHTPSWRSA